MPTKPLGPCRWPGCPNLQEPGCNGYCRAHRRQEWRNRESASRRGYSRQYEKTRAVVLKRQPLCLLCEIEGHVTPATVTHHLRPLAEGGDSRLDNLVPLCKDCHNRVHGKDGKELTARLARARASEAEQIPFF